MLGAIIGDIVGSRFEFDVNNHKSKERPCLKQLCKLYNYYQNPTKILWVYGRQGEGKTYILKKFASYFKDSYYFSFFNGIEAFKEQSPLNTEEDKWFEDTIANLADHYPIIILDDFDVVYHAWNNKLWAINDVYSRIKDKNTMLIICSREHLVMHPVFSMSFIAGKRMMIDQTFKGSDEIEKIYQNPHDALLSYSVAGYFPMGKMDYVYEDNHNYHDSILHLLEYRDYRIELLDKSETKNFKKQRCRVYANFLERFIRPFHQKDPTYVDQEELETYYQQFISPFLEEYLQDVIINTPLLKELSDL